MGSSGGHCENHSIRRLTQRVAGKGGGEDGWQFVSARLNQRGLAPGNKKGGESKAIPGPRREKKRALLIGPPWGGGSVGPLLKSKAGM